MAQPPQDVQSPDPKPKSPAGTDAFDDSLETLFGSVFESLTSSLVVFDKRLNISLRNRAAQDLLPETGNVAQALSHLTVEGNYVDWTGELRAIVQSRQPRRFDAMVPPEKNRPETYLEIVISPLRDQETGEAIGGLFLADDVSARISMERRLAVSERLAAVGKLAARVAHELNNPLDGILRYTNLAIRRTGDLEDPKIVEYLKNIKSGITRMSQILSALLEFSRSAPGAIEQATINKIVEDAITAMEGRAGDANVTVVCNFHQTDMPVVRGSSIFQVFCNLIKNAIDAMSEGGTLTITTDIAEADVVVTFEDTGVGLPDDADKVFEPFFTTKEQGQGTGLGLAVCKELIERYSGSITAARREPRGTVMTVRIPVRNCAAFPIEGKSGPQTRQFVDA
ncbi:MAG: ATP-binding protein [Phycisphaerales bacterium]|nr:ATP-binding protein [Phycisphaerales bacterium]